MVSILGMLKKVFGVLAKENIGKKISKKWALS